jgi:RimJ/RimL family protein N-acetyltransferase
VLLQLREYRIRDLHLDDAPAITRHADNPAISSKLRDLFPSPYSEEDARNFIRHVNSETPRIAFAIATDKEAFGVIGYITGQDVYRFSAEVGYWVGEMYWGRGIMTEAVKAFSDYLFETFEFNRLFAGVFSSNPASARVLEKAGYTREGILHCHVTKNGELLDEHLYARLRPTLPISNVTK